MRQRTDRNHVNAGDRHAPHSAQVDAARRFDDCAAGCHLHRLCDRRCIHVVEQYRICTGYQRVGHLLQRVAFDFDHGVAGRAFPAASYRFADSTNGR